MLSKSQYCRGLQCRKSLWLYRHARELASESPAMLQMIFDQGHLVGELACTRFPGGLLIKEDHLHPREAVAATREAVQGGARTLYEAGAIYDEVLIRADILTRSVGKSWDLIEVKSSTSVKEVYLDDLSIQRYVLEGAGYEIHRTFLVHINNKYVRAGEIDVHALFSVKDVTEEVLARRGEVGARVKALRELVAEKEAPEVSIGAHCSSPYPCDFMDYCWRDVPEDSVYSVGGLYKHKAEELWGRGIRRIADIPEDYKLTAKQKAQVEAVRSGQAQIDHEEVRRHLSELVYPLYFFDFETVGPAIPPYDGLRPFENIPFQVSIHRQEAPDGPVTHKELLVEPDCDPRPEMAAFLADSIGPQGSVIAYSAAFEEGCLQGLAKISPAHGEALLSMKDRLWDIAVPFAKGHYVDAAFQGSWSLKKVLPVLVPSMTYVGMAVSDGGTASKIYFDAMDGRLTGAAKDQAFAALKVYCGQDTLATVELLKVLRR